MAAKTKAPVSKKMASKKPVPVKKVAPKKKSVAAPGKKNMVGMKKVYVPKTKASPAKDTKKEGTTKERDEEVVKGRRICGEHEQRQWIARAGSAGGSYGEER